jgi:hypothetical protein
MTSPAPVISAVRPGALDTARSLPDVSTEEMLASAGS